VNVAHKSCGVDLRKEFPVGININDNSLVILFPRGFTEAFCGEIYIFLRRRLLMFCYECAYENKIVNKSKEEHIKEMTLIQDCETWW